MTTRNLRHNSTAPDLWHPEEEEEQQPLADPDIDLEEEKQEPIMAAVTEWKTDPLHGNFNPTTKLGHQIYLEKTKGLPASECLELLKGNASEKIETYTH